MSYELDDEMDELEDNHELFSNGIEEVSNGIFRETKEIGNGIVCERIKGVSSYENQETPEIIGEPQEDMKHWHYQTEGTSCAIACQEFVAEELLNTNLDENKMINYAEQHGWYEDGTSPEDAGKLLESMGLNTERQFGGSLESIENILESGGKVMVSVNNCILKNPEAAGVAGMGANHMVEVIGIDCRDPNNIKVILNDPGVKNGCGIEHNAADFQKAWETGGCYLISAYKGQSIFDEKEKKEYDN